MGVLLFTNKLSQYWNGETCHKGGGLKCKFFVTSFLKFPTEFFLFFNWKVFSCSESNIETDKNEIESLISRGLTDTEARSFIESRKTLEKLNNQMKTHRNGNKTVKKMEDQIKIASLNLCLGLMNNNNNFFLLVSRMKAAL